MCKNTIFDDFQLFSTVSLKFWLRLPVAYFGAQKPDWTGPANTSSIPPHVLQKRHFREFVNALNGKYLLPSQMTFEDSLVPSYAATVWVAMINYIKECWDLMLSFNGGKLGKKKFYSIHATTPNCQSFCLDLDDVT